MTQKWKTDPKLYNCDTVNNKGQINKKLDYDKTYIKEFLNSDPIKDWESIDRCIQLWEFFDDLVGHKLDKSDIYVLDCGTKDGQFPNYLNRNGIKTIGIEVSKPYVEYAKSLNRNVDYGDVCNLKYKDNTFDVVFSHHLLGLVSDYRLALKEMMRVLSTYGYLVTLNDIPGNKKKHYSYVEDMNTIREWLLSSDFLDNRIIYFDRNPLMPNTNEKILIVEKIQNIIEFKEDE